MKKISFILSLLILNGVFYSAKAQINLGNLLNAGVETIKNATATSNFEASDLVGTWNYVSPAVSFKGDDALANIGGAAAATALENKLEPYYQKLGIQNSQLTVNEDLTFTWKVGAVTLNGNIEKSADSDLVFHFSALGKVSLGSVSCMATKSGSTINLTFDASKLLDIAQKISSLSSNSSLQSISNLLSNYQDLYLGAKLNKAGNGSSIPSIF